MKQRDFLLPMVLVAGLVSGSDTAAGDAGAGRVSTLAEVPGGTGGLVVDRDGFVYSADFGAILGDPKTAGTRLFRIAPDGETSVFARGFDGASGVALGADGSFYQSNIRGGFISRVAPDGQVTTFVKEGVSGPVGVVVDDQGVLWIANCGGNSIQKITADGSSSRFVESPLFKCPNGITLDPRGNLYVANFYSGDVIKITPGGEATVLATLPGGNNGHIVFAHGVLYVVARKAHQIYTVSLEGEVTLFAGSGEKGGADGALLEASFCFPNDIAVSPDGRRLYVNEVADETSEGRKLAPTRIRILER
ncbi:MAG: SMP-30/gluconolactonase/LRE family protein [Acidobacteriota bacterium]